MVYKRESLSTTVNAQERGNIALQQGARGIFIGFPKSQAGYLIYVDVPRQVQGNYVISNDASFDDNLDSALVDNVHVFRGGRNVRQLGTNLLPRNGDDDVIEERTGDLSQIQPMPDVRDVIPLSQEHELDVSTPLPLYPDMENVSQDDDIDDEMPGLVQRDNLHVDTGNDDVSVTDPTTEPTSEPTQESTAFIRLYRNLMGDLKLSKCCTA